MGEFFGFGGYQRTPEGYLSWQHLLFVSILTAIMIFMGVWLGLMFRHKDDKAKNRVLMWTGFIIDFFYILGIVIVSIRDNSPTHFLYDLPLFLCSIQFISIPLAAFAKGRVKEACLDFILIFGILGGTMGNYGAGQNFSAYPVLSFDNVNSGITHSISGFASLYIAFSGMMSMKKKNIPITFLILVAFCVVAYIVDITLPYNYMFLMRGDGTPYDIFYNLVNGNRILYPLIVVLLFLLYISAFYGVYFLIVKLIAKKKAEKERKAEAE